MVLGLPINRNCYVTCYVTKIMKKYTRKVTRVGKRSLSVVIPAEIVGELNFRERQKVVVYRSGRKVVIKDWSAGNKD